MKRTSDKVIVTFADEAGNYRKAVDRMEQSLIMNSWNGDFLPFHSFEEIGSPPHKGSPDAVPYAFKAYAMKKAIDMGYTELLWLDSVIYATQSLNPIFDHIKREGYIFFENIGFSVGDFTSDACIEKRGWDDRDGCFEVPMTMACCYGVSMESYEARKVMEEYIAASADGVSYIGDWFNDRGQVSVDKRVKGHRHDQSVQSMICYELGLTLTKGQETFFAYKEHYNQMKIADSVCLISQGL